MTSKFLNLSVTAIFDSRGSSTMIKCSHNIRPFGKVKIFEVGTKFTSRTLGAFSFTPALLKKRLIVLLSQTMFLKNSTKKNQLCIANVGGAS